MQGAECLARKGEQHRADAAIPWDHVRYDCPNNI